MVLRVLVFMCVLLISVVCCRCLCMVLLRLVSGSEEMYFGV